MVRRAIFQFLLLAYLLDICLAVREWNDFRVKFGLSKCNGFFKLPLNTSSEELGDYVKVENEPDFDLPVDIYCLPGDPRGCIMYDKRGNAAGYQITFVKEDFAGVKPEDYDISKIKNFKQTNFFDIPGYSYRIYFTHPEKLTEKGRQDTTELAEGIWVYLDGELFEVPRHQPSTPVYEGFYKQGCLMKMGEHYFYGINANVTNCKTIFPLFFLYDESSLVGFGLSAIGKGSAGPKRVWYETPSWLTVEALFESSPSCLIDLAKDYGSMFMHVYLVDKPWKISCNFVDTIINEVSDWIPFC